MEVDEERGKQPFSLKDIYSKLTSNLWYMKVEAYETLLKEIIDYEPAQLQQLAKNSVLENIVLQSVSILQKE